jgi:moderate conductance mechanosensitive channel
MTNTLMLTWPSWASWASWDEIQLARPIRIVALIVAAAVLTAFVRGLVKRATNRIITLPGADKERARVRQQAFGTVLRSTVVGIIWATVVIAIIGELGINIGAFVATATIIGGALAFGAQTLVRDAIAGFFVIAEDQYGVGDAVDLGHATGVVERITLRSARLRDGEGRIWHVPHGGVVRVANLSKSPKATIDIDVARTSHLDEIDSATQRLCDALASDAEVLGALIDKPISDGLIEVRDDRLVYRLSVATRAGENDRVRRRWRVLALGAFERGELVAPAAPSTVVHIGKEVGGIDL